MKRLLYTLLFIYAYTGANAGKITSPNGKLCVDFNIDNGILSYSATLDGKVMLTKSYLGIRTDIGDYTKGLTMKDVRESKVDTIYYMHGTKKSCNHYIANRTEIDFTIPNGQRTMTLEMQVSDNAIAYRYHFDGAKTNHLDEPRHMIVYSEASSFNFPSQTSTFLCPQIEGKHIGWMGTKPSYEEDYKADAAMTEKSAFGYGYTFPCLFHVRSLQNGKDTENGWVLISETGVGSNYCGSRLSDYDKENGYTIAYPEATENHGFGSQYAGITLPGATPWRTITMGTTLKPIVETTISYDVVNEQYKAREEYKPGRYTWSWLLWQDNSINFDDQKKFIDVSAAMGFEYCLVDNWWDTQIGREKIAELSKYAQSKGVHLMLWYNSNGYINDAPQGPRNCMNTSMAREKEMSWLESIGVKGIKVDFFGGDKQQTMQLYEDILSDANRHGIQVIFHGCTLPRGWEKMYPNFVASEAVLASENVYFSESHAKAEGFELTMHPFSRNATASMDWGGCIMNRYLNKEDNAETRHRRHTSDIFEMASGIVNQSRINAVILQPSNLETLPDFELDFLKGLPTTWDETQFIDGYPTKYVVLARKTITTSEKEGEWYVAGLNGESSPKTLTLSLPMFACKTVTYYTDAPVKKGEVFPTPLKKTLKVDKNGMAKVTLQGMGGFILKM